MAAGKMKDETTTNPLELLALYRELCESAGAAGTTGHGVPRELREELSRVEAELQTRLWLATAETGVSGTRKPPGRDRGREGEAKQAPLGLPREVEAKQAPLGLPREAERAAIHEGTAMVYCDGACIGNPGPGGYGVLVRVPDEAERKLSAGKARTTNNEMELTAALVGLKEAYALGARAVTVVSDSEYLVKGMTSWVRGWLRNGWKTRSGEPVKNRQLWEDLHRLTEGEAVTWSWTRGHSGQPENELCDRLATAAAEQAARARRG